MSNFTLDKAGNYGEVRTVNGIKPDEHGNVNVAAGLPTYYIFNDVYDNNANTNSYSDGLYDALEKMNNHNEPIILMLYKKNYDGRISVDIATGITSKEPDGMYWCYCFDSSYRWFVYPDGTAGIEYYD